LMPSRLWFRNFFRAIGLALLIVACSENSTVEPPSPVDALPPEMIVSGAAAEVSYVSLPAGSLPNVEGVTVRNITVGAAQSRLITVVDGGFDPFRIAARAGDELEIRMTVVGGATTVYRTAVPKRRPPRVVRTNPPKGIVDVPLNSRVLVVFSEPIASGTVTTSTIRLLQGSNAVPGTVRLVPENLLEAEFVPDKDLASGTTYSVVVTRGILDVEGEALEEEVTTDFSTVTNADGILAATIVAGGAHSCALSGTGSVVCWGANWAGQLGTGNQVRAFGSCPWEYVPNNYNPFPCSNAPAAVAGGHTFASITLGLLHTCGLTTSGEAFCWGNNPNGELGSEGATYCNPNNPGPPSAPYKCSGVPIRVSGGLRFSSIVAGYNHTCGISVGGAAYCWGLSPDGSLGTGQSGSVASPAPVLGGLTFTTLTSGASHICGLTSNGAAYCWGVGEEGQLGTGGVSPGRCRVDATTTVACAKSPVAVSGELVFASISAGLFHTCALTSAGRAYCWGVVGTAYSEPDETWLPSQKNSYGPVPAPVSGDLVFVSLSSSPTAGAACGVTAANVAYCWGGSETNTLEPTRVPGGLAFSQVGMGGAHACGLTTAEVMYCWGDNFAGQLGVGNNASAGSSLPIRVSGQ
jgi:alpha-tubulin suppressor-like RCC1 family protein